jgi:hypothetical protein
LIYALFEADKAAFLNAARYRVTNFLASIVGILKKFEMSIIGGATSFIRTYLFCGIE